jgi:hypothetical protein
MLTTHPHLVPRSWMSRSYTSSLPQAPPWRVDGLLYFFTGFLQSNFCFTELTLYAWRLMLKRQKNDYTLASSPFVSLMTWNGRWNTPWAFEAKWNIRQSVSERFNETRPSMQATGRSRVWGGSVMVHGVKVQTKIWTLWGKKWSCETNKWIIKKWMWLNERK